jgi:hypothetical protein
MKTYLSIVAAIILLAFATMIGLSAVGIYACFDCALLKYQELKIESLSDVDTVILGDSSVGFALDARAFSELSGRKTVNLALTGYNYGFPGAYALLNQLLAKARPNNVVIAITPQTYALTITELDGLPIRGFLQASRSSPQSVFSISPSISREAAKVLSNGLFDKRFLNEGIDYLKGRVPPLPEDFQHFDYMRPYTEILDVKTVIETWGANVTHDYDPFFSKMGKLCHENGLPCICTAPCWSWSSNVTGPSSRSWETGSKMPASRCLTVCRSRFPNLKSETTSTTSGRAYNRSIPENFTSCLRPYCAEWRCPKRFS